MSHPPPSSPSPFSPFPPSPFSPPSPPSPISPPSPPSSPPAFCVDYEATEYLPVAAHFLDTNGQYLVWNGQYIDWPVAASSPVAVQVNFQYALEDISRDMGLSLNGVAVQVVAFPSSDTPTGVVWGRTKNFAGEEQFGKGRTQFVSMTLAPDSNIIRLMSIGTSGPAVDQMRICGLPQPPSPAPPPMSPPSPPPPSPTKLGADLLWAVPTLCVLLVAALALLVLIYRRHSRVSRDRANLRISRDRANVDLQMITHQVQRGHLPASFDHLRVPAPFAPADDSRSLPDSLPTKFTAPAGSLPPGPPSSTAASQPQLDSLSEQQFTALADATVVSVPPELPPSSAASLASVATAKASGKGKRKMKAAQAHGSFHLALPPLTWAEADRLFYASAAGKAYLAAATTTGSSTAPRTSAAPPPSAARPLEASEPQAVPQLAEVSPAQSVASVAHMYGTTEAHMQQTRPAKKAMARKFTSEGVEIHDALDPGAQGFWSRYMVPALKKIQFDRDQAPSSDAPTPTPAPTPALATAQSVEPPEAETDQQWQAKNAGAACHIARTAPSTPSAVGLAEGPDLLSLAELAGLTEISNDEAAAALAAACPRGPH